MGGVGWELPAGVAAVKMIESPHGGGWWGGVVEGLNIH